MAADKASLSPAEAHGMALFNDMKQGNCASCHPSTRKASTNRPPIFTDFGFVALAVPRNPELPANRDPKFFDLGLRGPLRADLATHPEYCGMFRTPSLRNVALRKRFFHNGAIRSLRDAVAFYATRDTNPAKWYPGSNGKARYDDLPERYWPTSRTRCRSRRCRAASRAWTTARSTTSSRSWARSPTATSRPSRRRGPSRRASRPRAHNARMLPIRKTLIAACLALGGCAFFEPYEAPKPFGPCGFDVATLQFAGDALTQARCLLRPVAPGGVLSPAPADLPRQLALVIGQPVGDLKAQLRLDLEARHVDDAAIGGSLDAPLSRARDGDPGSPAARYFVLHDTSVPWLGDAATFPPDDDPSLNDLARFSGPDAVAHMFVNRNGATLMGHDFGVPWRATQLETRRVGVAARGLFLHVEFAQPRRRDPAGGPRNDLVAPTPGFTDAQYRQMALLYAVASARRGDWLIPAFHAALDEGIPGAHDDPQHFEIERFANAVWHLRLVLAESARVRALAAQRARNFSNSAAGTAGDQWKP